MKRPSIRSYLQSAAVKHTPGELKLLELHELREKSAANTQVRNVRKAG